ncbi:MAG: TULIP family P47-like protein [Roseibium sp.]|uniref:TULIP family P47-like protein n=1 Tax=Roseibium sp. TaxID=1936156 RepID=UPI00261895A1|nr:TULIP family P47-like protein [Roseibium sp.]MCV0427015.1 TULIP family P47-like protein [Roseibium sp.]
MKLEGWDTVFLVKEDRLNTMLRENAGELVLDFCVEIPDGTGATASGKFSAWQIAQGGSNEIIHLRLPIAEGKLIRDGVSIDLTGMTLVVATYLDWLSTSANAVKLQLDYDRLGERDNPPNRGELSVVTLLDPNGVLSPSDNALLSFQLGSFLVANADKVRFVFATVNLVPPQTNSWLTPVKSAYAYFHREGLGEGCLAIFSVTSDKDISNLQKKVDPIAWPVSTEASYVVSAELFLLNVIAPGLATAFNTDTSAFAYDSTQDLLVNTRPLNAKSVKSGAITYYPRATQLEVKSGDAELRTHCEGDCDMKAGIMMTYKVTSKNAATYEPGNGSLAFAPDPDPVSSHKADIPWWFFIGGPIVILITELVVSIISSDIASDISKENKERLALKKHPPESILVGDDGRLVVSDIAVAGALIIRGSV